jgi:hypothetical protein
MKTLFVVALAFIAAGCSLFDDHERTVVMPVDEVRVAEVVQAGEPLEATFVGLLTNGCQQFERIEVTASGRGARVRMEANEQTGGLCTADVRYVERTHQFHPRSPGAFVIEVRQPNGSVTEREIRVE